MQVPRSELGGKVLICEGYFGFSECSEFVAEFSQTVVLYLLSTPTYEHQSSRRRKSAAINLEGGKELNHGPCLDAMSYQSTMLSRLALKAGSLPRTPTWRSALRSFQLSFCWEPGKCFQKNKAAAADAPAHAGRHRSLDPKQMSV